MTDKNDSGSRVCPEFVNEEYVGVTTEEEECASRKRTPRPPLPKYVFIIISLIIVLAFAGGSFWYYHENVLPEKYFRKAAASFERENYSDALDYYVKVLKIRPERKDVFYNAAVCCEKVGRTDDAIYYYKEHLRETKKDARALARLGWLYMNKGQYVEALRAFEEATERNKENSQYWHFMSKAAEKAGDREKLAHSLEKCVAFSDSSEVSLECAKKLMKLGEWEKALASYSKTAEKFPEERKALHGIHAAEVMLGSPSDTRLVIVPGVSLGKIRIGADMVEVLNLLGEPDRNIRIPGKKAPDAEVWTYKKGFFRNRGVRIVFVEGKVREIETFADVYKTNRGIGLSNFLLPKNAGKLTELGQDEKGSYAWVLKEDGVTFYASCISSDGQSAKYKRLSVHKKGTKAMLFDIIRKLAH